MSHIKQDAMRLILTETVMVIVIIIAIVNYPFQTRRERCDLLEASFGDVLPSTREDQGCRQVDARPHQGFPRQCLQHPRESH